MKSSQLNLGQTRRLLYIENKDGTIDGYSSRVGWAEFSKTGRTVYYRGRRLRRIPGGGVCGNHRDEESGEEYWISGVKQRGSNQHWAEPCHEVHVDEDAREAYEEVRREP